MQAEYEAKCRELEEKTRELEALTAEFDEFREMSVALEAELEEVPANTQIFCFLPLRSLLYVSAPMRLCAYAPMRLCAYASMCLCVCAQL
jgi:hypothetical protein